jgi:hypothetical protein
MATSRWKPFRNLATPQDRVNRIFDAVITHPRRQAEQEDLAAGQWSRKTRTRRRSRPEVQG